MMKSNNLLRSSRKLDHIKYALELPVGPGTTGLEDVHLIHRCLPELAWEEVDTATSFLGLSLSAPLIVNAITGGAQDVAGINASLARVAARAGIGMAVGSQTAALREPGLEDTYKVVRRENPHGVILANIGAHVAPHDARRAVEMIDADFLQIHLNPAQELVMPEGERDFRGILDNISKIVDSVGVPVIAKEVGCGIAWEDALALSEAGCRGIDIGGRGGTNFIAIEQARRADAYGQGLLEWGIPTGASLVEIATKFENRELALIASGGIRNSIEVAKCLALGAQVVGIAGEFLRILMQEGEKGLEETIMTLKMELKLLLSLNGVTTPSSMGKVPVVLTGTTAAWLQARGISLNTLASRSRGAD